MIDYCAAHDLIGQILTEGVARPVVDPDYTATIGLDRDQARALVAAGLAEGSGRLAPRYRSTVTRQGEQQDPGLGPGPDDAGSTRGLTEADQGSNTS